MNKKTLKIQSHLHVCGTDGADRDAERDLKVPDPEPEKAKAILDEVTGKETDDEETDEDTKAIDAASRADCAGNSENQTTE